jgi:hypothetical protein
VTSITLLVSHRGKFYFMRPVLTLLVASAMCLSSPTYGGPPSKKIKKLISLSWSLCESILAQFGSQKSITVTVSDSPPASNEIIKGELPDFLYKEQCSGSCSAMAEASSQELGLLADQGKAVEISTDYLILQDLWRAFDLAEGFPPMIYAGALSGGNKKIVPQSAWPLPKGAFEKEFPKILEECNAFLTEKRAQGKKLSMEEEREAFKAITGRYLGGWDENKPFKVDGKTYTSDSFSRAFGPTRRRTFRIKPEPDPRRRHRIEDENSLLRFVDEDEKAALGSSTAEITPDSINWLLPYAINHRIPAKLEVHQILQHVDLNTGHVSMSINNFGDAPIDKDDIHFVAVRGYTKRPDGGIDVRVLNSWGRNVGNCGEFTLDWNYLRQKCSGLEFPLYSNTLKSLPAAEK